LDTLGVFWERAHAPHWPRLRALLDADLAYRARALSEGGATRLFADLPADVRWTGDALEVERSLGSTVLLRGRGLLLMPSAFTDVSQHLSALRGAGLVTGRREGRVVLYARTELGDALLLAP